MIKRKMITVLFTMIALLCSMQCNATTTQHIKHPLHHSVKHKPTQHIKNVKHTTKKVTHKRVVHTHTRTHSHSHPLSHPKLVNLAPEESQSIETKPSLISSLGAHMVRFVHSTISTLRYTAYKLGGTHFDSSKGVYIIDCSDYVDHLLKVSNPAAYSSLVHTTGADKPTTEHYYNFFTGLTYKPRHFWNKVDYVKELQPGDILVFRNNKNSHTGVSGHVMVVMNKPTRIQNAFMVRVTDSASSGHSQDTRLPHTSGIGIGTMQIKVNPDTGEPSAYAWKLGSTFEHHVNFAMARPIED